MKRCRACIEGVEHCHRCGLRDLTITALGGYLHSTHERVCARCALRIHGLYIVRSRQMLRSMLIRSVSFTATVKI